MICFGELGNPSAWMPLTKFCQLTRGSQEEDATVHHHIAPHSFLFSLYKQRNFEKAKHQCSFCRHPSFSQSELADSALMKEPPPVHRVVTLTNKERYRPSVCLSVSLFLSLSLCLSLARSKKKTFPILNLSLSPFGIFFLNIFIL